jgi:hypothetical protein
MNLIKNHNASIFIVASIFQQEEENFRKNVLSLYPNVTIECHYENQYEYPGILKVWELGQIHNKENDLILYFHSKGVSRFTNYVFVKNEEYNRVITELDRIKEIFTIFPSIDKVGLLTGGIGWIWTNFWYARGSYISQLESPLKTTRRHYYEDWLARKVDTIDKLCVNERSHEFYRSTLKSCYQLITDKINIANIGSYAEPGKGFLDIKE